MEVIQLEKREYFAPEVYLKDHERLKYNVDLREFTRAHKDVSEGETEIDE